MNYLKDTAQIGQETECPGSRRCPVSPSFCVSTLFRSHYRRLGTKVMLWECFFPPETEIQLDRHRSTASYRTGIKQTWPWNSGFPFFFFNLWLVRNYGFSTAPYSKVILRWAVYKVSFCWEETKSCGVPSHEGTDGLYGDLKAGLQAPAQCSFHWSHSSSIRLRCCSCLRLSMGLWCDLALIPARSLASGTLNSGQLIILSWFFFLICPSLGTCRTFKLFPVRLGVVSTVSRH